MVPGVQAEAVQQDVRERRSNARGAHPDAGALLGRPRAPQTAHRLLLVGGGGGDVMTSIARNGITTLNINKVVGSVISLPSRDRQTVSIFVCDQTCIRCDFIKGFPQVLVT